MDCFHDFCLACDREVLEGPYCSQTCRLSDLEKATPIVRPELSSERSITQQDAATIASSDYLLAPPYQFPQRFSNSNYRVANHGRQQSASSPGLEPFDHRHQQSSITTGKRSLSPSSSRSSMTYAKSPADRNSISEENMRELREYFRSFDQLRRAKRRQSMY